jgi:predicted sulfurtransferase
MGKIIIFYKYVDIQYPKQILKWLQKVCTDLGLKGRIILAHEGINATLAGESVHIDRYKEIMSKHPFFGEIDFKEDQGSADYFPRLRIVVKEEIVRLGVSPSKVTARQAGKHLTPDQTHALFSNKPDNLVILDARNNFESRIGKFADSITPDIDHFRDFPEYLEKNIELFKNKQVVMYCTAGIRCERASALLKEKGVAQEVYQMEGGIQRYVEKYPEGFFRGKNYVFDARVSVRVNNDILSNCKHCAQPCDDYTNCLNAKCNEHFISCTSCLQQFQGTCSSDCLELLSVGKTAPRPAFKKAETTSCSLT